MYVRLYVHVLYGEWKEKRRSKKWKLRGMEINRSGNDEEWKSKQMEIKRMEIKRNGNVEEWKCRNGNKRNGNKEEWKWRWMEMKRNGNIEEWKCRGMENKLSPFEQITGIHRSAFKNRGALYTPWGCSIRCVREDQSAVTNVVHYLSDGTCTIKFSHRKQVWQLINMNLSRFFFYTCSLYFRLFYF